MRRQRLPVHYDVGVAELLVVSGAPGSGKTTLAREIGGRIGLAVLEKDALKEALSDAVGLPADVAASSRLGSAAYAALFTLARDLLANQVGVVLESNFRRESRNVSWLGSPPLRPPSMSSTARHPRM